MSPQQNCPSGRPFSLLGQSAGQLRQFSPFPISHTPFPHTGQMTEGVGVGGGVGVGTKVGEGVGGVGAGTGVGDEPHLTEVNDTKLG